MTEEQLANFLDNRKEDSSQKRQSQRDSRRAKDDILAIRGHDDIIAIRGGAVHESQTLSDLESRIQSAALQNKLTVIDFTATW